MSKKHVITFNEIEKDTFEKIKEIVTTDDILIYPDFSQDFHLTTDASDYAIGADLSYWKKSTYNVHF